MLRKDISLFHAAKKSALEDPVIQEVLSFSARESIARDDLDEEQISIVENYKNGNRILPSGATLLYEGDTCKELYILLDGWVSMSRRFENGKQLILNYLMPGTFLGFQPELHAPMDNTVRCVTDVVVCVFPRTAFMKLLEINPALAQALSLRKAEDEKFMHNNLINIATRPARARLAHLLLELHARVVHAYPEQPYKDIYLPLTQGDIADTLGLSSVHVNRAIRSLHKEKIMSMKKNRLQIHDFERLAEVAKLSERSTV